MSDCGRVGALLLLVPAISRAGPTDAAPIDAIIKDGMKAWQVPGAAVAIVRDDEVVYIKKGACHARHTFCDRFQHQAFYHYGYRGACRRREAFMG